MDFKTFLIFLIMIAEALTKELPDFLYICKRNDPNLQTCIKESVTRLKPYLAKGIPELKVPSIEPLKLKDTLILNPSRGQSVGIKLSARNIDVYGCSNFEIQDMNFDIKNFNVKYSLKLPQLYIKGHFEIEGKVLFIPIKGSGKFVANFTDCYGSCELNGELVKRNGETYLQMNTLKEKYAVGKGALQVSNLFTGDRVLADIISNVINENFDSIAPEFIPPLERELDVFFLELTHKILAQYTFDQLFPLS